MAFYKYDGSLAAVTTSPVRNYYGTAELDNLFGGSEAEGLWGGDSDVMTGGAGDDTYHIKSSGDVAVEYAESGIDRIEAWRNISLSKTPFIENLKVSGDDRYGAGNALDNIIEGRDGRQQLYGGLGQDVLSGGVGADVFIVYKGEGNDVIQDFNPLEDSIRLKAGFATFDEMKARLSQVGADVKIDLGGGDGLILRNTQVSELAAGHFQLQFDPASLGALTFSDEFASPLSFWDAAHAPGGTWRADFGYQGSNGLGSYTLPGNGELQTYTSPYFRDHDGDFAESPFVVNADGTLSIWAKPSTNPEIFGYGYTSGALTTKQSFSQLHGYFEIRADVPEARGAWPAFWLVPNDGSWPPELDVMETLSKDPHQAWTSAHTAAGGSHTSTGAANYVPETGDGMHTYGALWTPTELVYYIDGVEVFRTATPADMTKPMHMIVNMAVGGWGGDVAPGALPAEFKIDYVRAYALPTLVTTAATRAAIEGTAAGEVLTGASSDDFLYGFGGNDQLDGLGGADAMAGGVGNDTYIVDNAGDVLTELRGEGIDTVFSSISFTLGDNVERLALSGSGAIDGVGNELNNRLNGNAAANVLTAGAGNDILDGEGGADTMRG
ncbi:MAG TPA: family 16 glycosylhydrolase, partial [Brevundimonas sp.]|nr:family 16 glycosylhydrolase [Brevundimonas sp.]